MPPLINRIFSQVFKIWRARRHQLFCDVMVSGSGVQGAGIARRIALMLDVGGYPAYWTPYEPVADAIHCLNIHPIDWDEGTAPSHHITTRIGNGCVMPEYADGAYEVVFSNSVIEHVGTWEDQQSFAAEVRRVGRRLWVQTPAYECPIEPHYLAPLVHYLPREVRRRILRWFTPWGWIARPTPAQVNEMVDTTRLLTKGEMTRLFPDCEIRTERMLWIIPKSYIAIRLEDGV